MLDPAKAVQDAFDKLPEADELTLEDKEALAAVLKAYEELSENSKNALPEEFEEELEELEETMAELDNPEPEPEPEPEPDPEQKPEIIGGKDQTIDLKGDDVEAVFRSSAEFDTFVEVQVDGKKLDGSNYTVHEGSTIVVLKEEYVMTLSNGKHTVTIVSTTGSATAEFTITGAQETPDTGDHAVTGLWAALMLLAGAAIALTLIRRRRYE